MVEFLTKADYPSLENKDWKPLDYDEWVKRSFITSLLKPTEFNLRIQQLVHVQTGGNLFC
ncbi:MAG: hypothetical protein ACFFD4_37995 [Candidatus Odinarchaeota archaeon]